jgi:type I restriction enzyme S subunit
MSVANGWSEVSLGRLLTKSDEMIGLDPQQEYKEITVRLWGRGVALRRIVTGAEIASIRRNRVHANEFILSRIDARNGAMGLVPEALDGAVVSSDFPVFSVDTKRLLPAFIGWLCRTQGFVDSCRHVSEGTTNRVRLKEEKFYQLKIPLPPLEEQRRIVAKIEHLAAKIDEAKGLRNASYHETGIVVNRASSAVFLGLNAPRHPLGELLRETSRNGLSARPADNPPGAPILRISAGTSREDGIVDESDFKYLEVNEQQIETYGLAPGDLLACRFNGNLHYVGRFSLFKGESGEVRLHPDKLIRFRVDKARVLPEYVRSAMNSSVGREAIESFCQTTAGNIGISAKNLNTVRLPVPSLAEQRRIVAYLDGLQAKVDELKRLQAQTAAELDALLPSLLDRAFKGEL